MISRQIFFCEIFIIYKGNICRIRLNKTSEVETYSRICTCLCKFSLFAKLVDIWMLFRHHFLGMANS